MKKNPKRLISVHDDPATRKRRLQQRLQELNDKTERELDDLMKSVEKVKSTLRPNRHQR